MNVHEIVEQYLVAHGYDGLYSEHGECGCDIEHLGCCDDVQAGCQPGYKRMGCNDDCGEGCDFHIVATQELAQ
jgi:hypothetical protein